MKEGNIVTDSTDIEKDNNSTNNSCKSNYLNEIDQFFEDTN